MKIEIQSLTPELAADYFDLFDNRAFTDHAEWSCCYCTTFHTGKEFDQKIEKTYQETGGENFWTENIRCIMRGAAERFVTDGTLHGYLAYADGIPVGWCNAGEKISYARFDLDTKTDRFIREFPNDGVISVLCFVTAPEYRGKGVAAALLDRVVSEAKANGYSAVEGYPRRYDKCEPYDFNGPLVLFEHAGFQKAYERDGVVIMRNEFLP